MKHASDVDITRSFRRVSRLRMETVFIEGGHGAVRCWLLVVAVDLIVALSGTLGSVFVAPVCALCVDSLRATMVVSIYHLPSSHITPNTHMGGYDRQLRAHTV
eukprot:scaffold190125_cov36-Cyclotella_meneghiniana.AAC.1